MKQILAWVKKAEKKSLIEENKNNNPNKFDKNMNDFIEKISPEVFPIISIKKAHKIKTIRAIVRSFPYIRFYAMARLDSKFTTPNEFSFIYDELNVANSDHSRAQYDAFELISLFETQTVTRRE
jgi:hypothetical protein